MLMLSVEIKSIMLSVVVTFQNVTHILMLISVYQDESSDELSEALDDLLLPASDTEDIWQQDGDDQVSKLCYSFLRHGWQVARVLRSL